MSFRASSLPADIIAEFFEWSALENPPQRIRRAAQKSRVRYELGWIALTHVSRHWRVVGLSLTPLWASIVSSFHRATIADELLSRAGDLPLTIDIVGGWDMRSSQAKKFASFFEWGVAHLHRAHSVHCYTAKPLDTRHIRPAVTALDNRQLPALRGLFVGSKYPMPRERTRFFSLDAPGLVVAHMNNAVLSPLSGLPNLRTLKLGFSTGSHSLSLLHITTLLRAAPRLEVLDLMIMRLRYQLNPAVWDAGSTDSNLEVTLNYLSELSINCLECTQVLDLWSMIHAPHATTVIISLHQTAGSTSPAERSALSVAFKRQLSYYPYQNVSIAPLSLNFTTCEQESPAATFILTSSRVGTALTKYAELLSFIAEQAAPASFTAFTRIHTLTLDFPYKGSKVEDVILQLIGEGKLDQASRHSHGQDVLSIGQHFVNATALNLSGNAEDLALLGYAARKPLPPFLPVLKALTFKIEPYSDVIRRGKPGALQIWWKEVKVILAIRAEAGIPVPTITFTGRGELCQRASWTEIWEAEASECLARGILHEVVDEQEWIVICDACNEFL